ncbi:hypothetical protein [Streptomyces longisporoflavus]|uniref:Uncharacterized protein n=1 Tax=Streptomyces longisporoflavus TaxID=28044 RepID=A0ABW7QFZ0_9ACTN
MVAQRPGTGVCLVRVEVQLHSVLITVCTYADVERDTAGTQTSTTDVESAVQTVREFLLDFLAAGRDS